MRIIISLYDDLKNPVYAGGGALSAYELAKRLGRKNQVTVITGTYKHAKNEVLEQVAYIRIGSDFFGHKIGQLIYQIALPFYAIKLNYDMWIESTTPPFTFSLLPLFTKKPVLAWVNMLCSADMQRKYRLNFQIIERFLARLYSYIVVPTEFSRQSILKMNKKATLYEISFGFTLPSKVNSQVSIQSQNTMFLYLGRIEVNQKGLDLLIEAASLTNQFITVIIAGNGSKAEEKLMLSLINRYGVGDRVKFVGRVGGDVKEKLIIQSNALIIPSRFETFNLVALESIGHQKPVVCFDIPQLSWIPDKYSFKIATFSPAKLANIMDDIAAKVRTKVITQKEKNSFLKPYNWDYVAAEFEKCICELFNKK